MMETRNGFTRFDTISEFESYINDLKITRTINGLQVHHMGLPDYDCFYKDNGSHEDELTRTVNLNSYGISQGWGEIAQHFNIFPNGKITTGRSINKTPVGITGWNTGKVCIEIYGCFDNGKDTMTSEQKKSVIAVYGILCNKFNLTPSANTIRAHAWFTSNGTYLGGYYPSKSRKSCPGTGFTKALGYDLVNGYGNTKDAFTKYFYPAVKEYMASDKVNESTSTNPSTQVTSGKYIVRYLQQVLNSQYKCNLVVDGLYGEKTKAQVKAHYLKKGCKGEHVEWLQKALVNRGYKIEVDGIFGPKTLEALKKYQKSRKLTVDGYAGVDTHTAIVND